MKFFIDTANLNDIREAQDLGVLDGVTTNPSLMAKEGITGKDRVMQHYKAICDIVDGDVSAEVIATTFGRTSGNHGIVQSVPPANIRCMSTQR